MPKQEKISCRVCNGNTNHSILFEDKIKESTPDNEIHFWETYQLVKCWGCDVVSLRILSGSSEDWDPVTGAPEISQKLYPSPTKGRSPIDGHYEFPLKTGKIYLETLSAINNNLPLLSAIGLRTLIESICIESNVELGNLSDSIDNLATSGLLSSKQAEFLHAHRFMGNDAAHEIIPPKPPVLIAALDIAETSLKTIYILPSKVDEIMPKPKIKKVP